MSFTVSEGGVERLLRSPDGAVGVAVARLLNRTANYARQNANVDTGYLRSSIGFEIDADGQGLLGRVYARASYATYVHDGTSRYAGNPFLTDAVAQALSEGL